MSFSDSLKVVNFLVKELPFTGDMMMTKRGFTFIDMLASASGFFCVPVELKGLISDEACRSDLYPAGRDLVFDIDARACVESNGNLLSRVGEHNALEPRLVLHLNVQRTLSSRETGNHRLSRIQLHLHARRRPERRRLLPGRIISPLCRIRKFSGSSGAPHSEVYTVCDLLSHFQLSTNRPGVGERLRNLVEDGSVVFGLDTAVVLELSRRHDDRFGVHSQYSRSDWPEGSLHLFPVVSLVDIVPRGRTLHVHVCGRCISELLDCPLQAPVSYVKGLPFPVADDFHILTGVFDLSFRF
ncbi:hypothetical protein SFRURICE_015131 [Spodoptera frugiperda]|nr:hypothetical protein SFRURICE_015131 [Spodoptera frugiperda]